MGDGYKVEIKRGEEVIKTAETTSINSSEVIKILDEYLAESVNTTETVPDDIKVAVSYRGKSTETPFAEAYAGFQLVSADATMLELRKQFSMLQAVSGLQAVEITALFRDEGVRGFTVIFADDFDAESASVLVNALEGHTKELDAAMQKQFDLVKQDDNLIIIPGRA